jgi:cold shock CspA family protein
LLKIAPRESQPHSGRHLIELAEGQRVRMQIGQGQKGLEARSIELLD